MCTSILSIISRIQKKNATRVTRITVGACGCAGRRTLPNYQVCFCLSFLVDIDPILLYRSIDERTLVYFADNPRHIIEADIESGEGIDRRVGFCRHPSPGANSSSPPFLSSYFLFSLIGTGTWWNSGAKDRRRL